MECPRCHFKVGFREIAGERCPCCKGKVYVSDRKWGWLRGVSSVLVAVLMLVYWFPRQANILYFLLWMTSLLIVFVILLIGSMFLIPPELDLVPRRGPIRLDI
jgi:hypothetical protein